MLALGLLARAPFLLVRAFMRKLVFQPCHGGGVVVRIEFACSLMREDIPVIFRAHGYAGSFRRFSFAAFGHGIGEFPLLRRDFFLLPLALVVIPFMAAADLHAGVLLAFKFFVLIV